MKYPVLFLFLFSSCFPEFVSVVETYGEYEDEEYGVFHSTLAFNSENIEIAHTADDVARIASLSLRMYKQLELENHENINDAVDCVNDSLIQVATEDTFFNYCPTTAIACNRNRAGQGTGIFVNEVVYNCRNRYTIGHEFLHDIVDCVGIPLERNAGHLTHNTFAWEGTEEVKDWNEESAEHYIMRHEDSKCSNEEN